MRRTTVAAAAQKNAAFSLAGKGGAGVRKLDVSLAV
jgi:hypothetical protein